MKLKAKNLDLGTDFSHYSERHRMACEQLQAKARELLTQNPTRYENHHPDVLLNAAADPQGGLRSACALGNADERYSRIYACETCGRLYHGDYSINSDPDHDYCGGDTCQPERSHRKYRLAKERER